MANVIVTKCQNVSLGKKFKFLIHISWQSSWPFTSIHNEFLLSLLTILRVNSDLFV